MELWKSDQLMSNLNVHFVYLTVRCPAAGPHAPLIENTRIMIGGVPCKEMMCVCVCLCVCACAHVCVAIVNVVEKETDHFLKQKDEWKLEIESRLAELKNMETALSGRELEIRKVWACPCEFVHVLLCCLFVCAEGAAAGSKRETLGVHCQHVIPTASS